MWLVSLWFLAENNLTNQYIQINDESVYTDIVKQTQWIKGIRYMYIKWFKTIRAMSENLKTIKNGTEIENGLPTLLALWLANQKFTSHPNGSKCQPYWVTVALLWAALRNTYHCCNLKDRQETATGLFGHVSQSDQCNWICLTLYLNLMVL